MSEWIAATTIKVITRLIEFFNELFYFYQPYPVTYLSTNSSESVDKNTDYLHVQVEAIRIPSSNAHCVQAHSLPLRHFWFNHMWWILICSLCEFAAPENQPRIHAYRTCTCSCKLPFAERAPRDHLKAIVHAYSPFRWGGSSIENTPNLGG